MAKLRCFVAMAFGKEDTDAVFAAIKRCLSHVDIRRVDRINHNDDIDKKIASELDAADFVIADLTYARQSVYWEAGYAQGRPIKVIYTAKKDHIGKQATADDRRVHFDLQMRNIIAWTAPNREFLKSLEARVALVTRPLIADRASAEAKSRRCREFASRSQHDQLETIAEWVLRYFKNQGFKFGLSGPTEPDGHGGKREVPKHRQIQRAMRVRGRSLQIAMVSIVPAITRDGLRWRRVLDSLGVEANLNLAQRPPIEIETVQFMFSLSRVHTTTLRTSFPHASFDDQHTLAHQGPTVYLPGQASWRSGKTIVPSYSSSFDVGPKRVTCNAKGMFLKSWEGSERRLGSASECRVVHRYRVISAITDPSEIPEQMDGTFRCGEYSSTQRRRRIQA